MLFFSKKQQTYYIKFLSKHCNNCNRLIDKIVVLQMCWGKKSIINYYCYKCVDKIKDNKMFKAITLHSAIITEDMPNDVIPIMVRPPDIRGGYNSDFLEKALRSPEELESENTVDNTVYANKLESFKGAKIGADIEADPKMLDNQEDVDKHLDMIAGATPVIPKRLEKK